MFYTSHTLQRNIGDCVIQDFNTKKYLYFNNVISMLRIYILIPTISKVHNEVIFEGAQKMRLDLDSLPNTISDDEWTKLIVQCRKLVREYTNGGSIAVFNMSDANKRSCHMVCVDRAYESSVMCKMLCMLIRNRLNDVEQQCIDTSIYSTIQHFRLEGSCKPGNLRYKYLTSTTLPSWTMTHGLIGYTRGLDVVKYSIEDTIQSTQAPNASVKIASSWCTFKRVDGNLVELTRTLPSYCTVCSRTHDKENPFLIINGDVARLYCRRATTRDSTELKVVNGLITI